MLWKETWLCFPCCDLSHIADLARQDRFVQWQLVQQVPLWKAETSLRTPKKLITLPGSCVDVDRL